MGNDVGPPGDFPVTHDTYLKLYQLSKPNLSSRYTTLLFDEAQDANPVISAIVLNQTCRVVLVGDTHQQIYRFRGADNAMQAPQLEKSDRLWLTHSFRFGPEVAGVANRLLALKGETHQITGRGRRPCSAHNAAEFWPSCCSSPICLWCHPDGTALVAGWQESILGWWYGKLQN